MPIGTIARHNLISRIMEFHFKALLQPSGWQENMTVSTDGAGIVTAIERASSRPETSGLAIPGFRNCHSHAFQYAMAGLAERHDRDSDRDDFWGWRDTMYKLALSLDPDQVESIATMLYSELVRLGYTHVCEFHYLHHDKDGMEYANPAEMSERLISAAETAGINITLLPVFYQKGGFGIGPLPEQRRFISPTFDDYASLLEHTAATCGESELASAGAAVHSLRAVDPEGAVRAAEELGSDLPFHIHISEQLKEVEDCVAHLGARPVKWLLDNSAVTERFNLVHATHADSAEVKGIAASGANVVLCPSTEGNLGDGIFPLRGFQEAGGLWSIGTDSHVGLDPFEELRLLDYGQRLTTHRRDVFAGKSRSGAENAILSAFLAGVNATGEGAAEYFEIGQPLNAFVIRNEHPLVAYAGTDSIADRILYAPEASRAECTIVNGRIVSENGRHVRGDEIRRRFASAIGGLAGEL